MFHKTPESVLKTFQHMSDQEILAWCKSARVLLAAKKARERQYLDRRKKRGTHTPTDEVMEQDQLLMAELLVYLEESIAAAERELLP